MTAQSAALKLVTLTDGRGGGATYGPAGLSDANRYSLRRQVGTGTSTVAFVMLNPSTATHLDDDATIRRCVGFARSWGFARLEVANLFAFRATDPAEMRAALARGVNIIGPENDGTLRALAGRASFVVCAWGNGGLILGRGRGVRHLLSVARADLRALRLGKFGDPAHPLYLSKSLAPFPWAARPEDKP